MRRGTLSAVFQIGTRHSFTFLSYYKDEYGQLADKIKSAILSFEECVKKRAKILSLVGFTTLWEMCHRIKHLIHAETALRKRIPEYNNLPEYTKLIEHFMKVNNHDRRTLENLIERKN